MAAPVSKSRVAVVLPVYNSLPYLDDVRVSLKAQTFADFAIIAVNDASNDGSRDFLTAWANEEQRLVVLDQEHGGLSRARNTALDYLAHWHETGPENCPPFVCFLDSDDKLAPEALEHLVACAEGEQVDIVEFSCESFFENEDAAKKYTHMSDQYRELKPFEGVFNGVDYLCACQEEELFSPQACFHFLRTSLILENGLRFFDGILHEDNLFTFESMLSAQRVCYLGERLYQRRVREGSIMTRPKSWANVYGYFRTGVEAIDFMERVKPLTEKQYWHLLWLVDSFFHNAALAMDECTPEDIEAGVRTLSLDDRMRFHYFTEVRREQKRATDEAWAAGAQEVRSEFEASRSFRLGRTLTALPRKLSGRP